MITKSGIRPAMVAVAATLLVAASFGSSAQAADFTVTSTADSEGPGTLRTAINDATASADASDRIVFGSGVTGTIDLGSALPPLPDHLKIEGPGSEKLAIDGGGSFSIFFSISDASISGLTLKNGFSPAGGGAVIFAGGTSVLDQVRIESSEGAVGGGVLLQSGTYTIKDSQLIDNKAQTGGGGFVATDSKVRITGSTISGNQGNLGGGGSVFGGEQESITITDSRFSDNTAGQGGGGLSVLTPTLEDYVSMKTEITGSIFTENKTTAGISENGLGGGAIFSGSSDTDIDSSLFKNNSTPVAGGAVYLNAPLPANKASITNSTFTGNTAEMVGAAIVDFTFGLRIDSSTITGNETTTESLPQYSGAGLFASLPVELTNSIVSGNSPADLSSSVVAEQAKGEISGSFNLIGKKPNAIYEEAVAGSDIKSGNPKLGPLADNGGPTPTMLPAADSPVVNKGSSFLGTDQRGLLRPVKFGAIPFSRAEQANGSDIGAVELQTNKFTFGKVKLMKKQGTAIVPVILPSSGKMTLESSRTVKGQTRSAKKATTVRLTIRAKGKAFKTLRKVGAVRVKASFTFRPRGGIPSTRTKSIRLAMKKGRG